MTAIILLALGLGGLAAGILVGRYYVPDDRELKRTARHARSYIKTINLLLDRNRDAAVEELVAVVAENVDDVEPYFALGALFRNRGEWERAIRVHQAIELREQRNRKLCLRARYQLGLDFRAAGMPRRATRAMEDCLADDPKSLGALRALCGLYEEQGRFSEAATAWNRIAKIDGIGDPQREHHLLCAAAQRAIEAADLDSAKRLLRDAERIRDDSPHFLVASAELAASKGNWQGASARLRQAMSVRPQLISYLAGPLRATEIELHADDTDSDRSGLALRGVASAIDAVHREIGDQPLLALASAEILAEFGDDTARASMDSVIAANPRLLAARVLAGRLALATDEPEGVRRELDALVGSDGVLASALGGSWSCAQCKHPSDFFFWRCDACRQWGSALLDSSSGHDKPFFEARERRAESRALLHSSDALPETLLDSGLSDGAKRQAAERTTALTRAGRWLTSALGGKGNPAQRSDDDLG